MICPICSVEKTTEQMFMHLLLFHPQMILALTTLYEDPINIENYVLNAFDQEDPFEDASYEELTQLCDRIGYVKINLSNEEIDRYAPITIVCKNDERDDTDCTICLEKLYTKINRKIVNCKHIFCKDCIEKWFKEKSCCPICKQDIIPSEKT